MYDISSMYSNAKEQKTNAALQEAINMLPCLETFEQLSLSVSENNLQFKETLEVSMFFPAITFIS